MKIKVKSLEELKAMRDELMRYFLSFEDVEDKVLIKQGNKVSETTVFNLAIFPSDEWYEKIAGKELDVKIRYIEEDAYPKYIFPELNGKYFYDYLMIYEKQYIYPYEIEWHEFMYKDTKGN